MRKRQSDVTQSGGYIHLSAKGAPTLKIPVESGDMAQQMWEAYRDRHEL